MQTFLMWRCGGDASGHETEATRVANRLLEYCSDLFEGSPRVTTLLQAGCAIVYLDLPVKGWITPYYQRDETHWALSLDFPVDADRVLKAAGRKAGDIAQYLPDLGRALNDDPAAILERLSPPFVLVWGRHGGDKIHVQNDGLGFGQIFEYAGGSQWALTNRVYTLKALGIELKPSLVEWATKCVLGWFPLEFSGYEGLSAVKPGTQLEVSAEAVKKVRHDVIGRWLARESMSTEDCLELGAKSVRDHLEAASRHWSQAVPGLSGGMDSRCVLATMVKAGIPVGRVRTHGLPSVKESIIACHLTKVAGLTHDLDQERALPVSDPARLRWNIEQALRWQCGLMETKAHKAFGRQDGPLMNGGRVNIMGKHGEIGRGYYHRRLGLDGESAVDVENRFLAYLMSYGVPHVKEGLRLQVSEIILQAIRQADQYGLTEYDKVDFFYLYERTRRWASGTIYSQMGKIITPFLNPDYIHAVYNMPGKERSANPFQMHIVANNMPIWRNVPYLSQKKAERWCKKQTPFWRDLSWRLSDQAACLRDSKLRDYYEPRGERYAYDNTRYWQTVGRGLIDEAVQRGDLINGIFDANRLREKLPPVPDILAVVYLVESVI